MKSTPMEAATENLPLECLETIDNFRAYAEGSLSMNDGKRFEGHVQICAGCRERYAAHKQLFSLMENTIGARSLAMDFEARAERKLQNTPEHAAEPIEAMSEEELAAAPMPGDEAQAASERERLTLAAFVATRLGAVPWWGVSAALHVLVIALAGLLTMAIDMPHGDDAVIMVTELQARPNVVQDKVEDKDEKLAEIMTSKAVTPTDPTSKEWSKVEVPPDIMAKAELGDHFETINPDRPDTQSAYGNPEAALFHSVTGNADAAGGGGTNGVGMEDVVGIGGAATRGTGGGFGGGDGTGIGTGSGSGRGSFGNRNGGGRRLMVARHGGSRATEGAVDKGLDWLARNQEADGHWDNQKHDGKNQNAALQNDEADMAVTGFAILAFLGAGHTEKVGKYKDNVLKAVAWLKAKQNPNGSYLASNYGHAIALMAMAEAAGMARVPDTIESAQKAVDCTVGAKVKGDTSSDRGGWGYAPTQLRDTQHGDMSNSGWAMMSLKSAKVANLHVPFEAIEGCHSYLDACEIGKVKGDSYTGMMFGYAPDPANKGKEPGRAICNSIGCLGRLFFGTPANEVENGAQNMIKVAGLPGGEKANAFNALGLYYMYYGTLVTFQVGGDTWKTWNESLKATLPPLQVKGGADDGSWNPQGSFSERWGRVGQTALSILCMEVYYRYQRLNQGL